MAGGRSIYNVVSYRGKPMDWPAMGESQQVTYGQADAIIGCAILTGADAGYWRIVRGADGAVMPPYAGPPAAVKKVKR